MIISKKVYEFVKNKFLHEHKCRLFTRSVHSKHTPKETKRFLKLILIQTIASL